MPENKTIWWDIDRTASYNCLFNFIIGNRGAGMTYGALKRCVTRWLRSGAQFVYMRRMKTNCVLNYSREQISGLNASCLGFGGNMGQRVDIRNCKFTNGQYGSHGIYMHGRGFAIGHLNVENCVFDTLNDSGICLSQYTGTTEPVDVVVSNSKVGNVTFVTQSGGNTDNQYRARFINSDVTPVVDPNTTLLYPYETITTVGS